MAKRRSNPLSEDNIKRIDRNAGDGTSAAHGFQVSIQRQGTVHTRFFADRLNGGTSEALTAARSYRDELMVQLPPPISPVAREFPAKSNTGVRGLSFRERINKDGTIAKYIQVHLRPEKGKVVNLHLRYTEANRAEMLAKAVSIREAIADKRASANEVLAPASKKKAK